jgi:hypothetical protein
MPLPAGLLGTLRVKLAATPLPCWAGTVSGAVFICWDAGWTAEELGIYSRHGQEISTPHFPGRFWGRSGLQCSAVPGVKTQGLQGNQSTSYSTEIKSNGAMPQPLSTRDVLQ